MVLSARSEFRIPVGHKAHSASSCWKIKSPCVRAGRPSTLGTLDPALAGVKVQRAGSFPLSLHDAAHTPELRRIADTAPVSCSASRLHDLP